MGLGRVHRHARLAHDVFTRFQHGAGHFPVHVRPGADDNGVGVIGRHERPPVVVDLRNAKRIGYLLRRLPATITHADDFHPGDSL
jgi:hypothetical protein